jgi:hypothetical protein
MPVVPSTQAGSEPIKFLGGYCREAGATGTEKESLDALGSKLTAFREGLGGPFTF